LETVKQKDSEKAYLKNIAHGNKWFCTATKLGTTNEIFVAATKNFAAATNRFVDRTKHFVVVTKYFFIPILTNDFVGITKPIFPWKKRGLTLQTFIKYIPVCVN